MKNDTVLIDGKSLTVEQLVAVARDDAHVELSADAHETIGASRIVVEAYVHGGEAAEAKAQLYHVTTAEKLSSVRIAVSRLEEGKQVAYGITTGFGELARVRIAVSDAEKLQYNLVRSHCAGTGPELSRDAVRASMLIRANTLATGFSGVRPRVVQHILDFLNKGLTPVIPSQGSVGSSGDLAPTAHMALALIGEGTVDMVVDSKTGATQRMPSREAMKKVGLQPLDLQSKEGLSLINGTQVMTGIAALCLWDAEKIFKAAVVAASMSLEALWGSSKVLDPRIHNARAHPGQIRAAAAMAKCVQDSAIVASHANCDRVQDAYSLRCAPQVLGPPAEAIANTKRTVEIEMNSATDNPLVFSENGEVLSNGNFHGEPVGMAMDFLGIALSEIASVAERRVARLVDPNLSGLPAFLSMHSGLHSGFMMAQYTAAALVSENKVLSHPAVVDTIPTSANQEDHVSMGTIAARKCADIVRNVRTVVAVELLIAAQGIDLHQGIKPGRGSAIAHAEIRKVVSKLDEDRVLANDMADVARLVESGVIVDAVEKVIGAI